MNTEGKGYSDLRSHPRLALYLYRTVHHIHNIFRDGHSQAGSLNFADGGGCFPLKGFKNAFYKLLAHADAGILN